MPPVTMSPEMRALIDDMAAECMAVGRQRSAAASPFRRWSSSPKIRAGEIPMSQAHAGSMALDIARGAPTEIDELTGFIVREGERAQRAGAELPGGLPAG